MFHGKVMEVYKVVAPFATAGVLVDEEGMIRDTAPIFRRWVGRYLADMVTYYDATIERLEDEHGGV